MIKRTQRGQVQHSLDILRLSRSTIGTFLLYYLNLRDIWSYSVCVDDVTKVLGSTSGKVVGRRVRDVSIKINGFKKLCGYLKQNITTINHPNKKRCLFSKTHSFKFMYYYAGISSSHKKDGKKHAKLN